MSHFVCGRQFIFEESHEKPRWILLGLLVVMVIGMLIGLLLGLVITFAGIFIFEIILLVLAVFILYDAYDLTFLKKSGAADKTGFAFMVMFCTGLLILFMAAMRYSAFALTTRTRCAIFSASGVALSLVAYAYARLCCQEDERKHHLGPCSPEGELETAVFDGHAAAVRNWDSISRFLAWILSGQCFFDINDWLVPADEDCSSKDRIVVHNQSLKLIKVCLYSSCDLVCWVPVGGIAGSCVGFIRSGERKTFTLPRPWRKSIDTQEEFKLKVFMPGLLDKELAAFFKARRGQSFAFVDVEGTVRRSRLLSAEAATGGSAPAPALRMPMESSEEEYAAASLAMASRNQRFDLSAASGSFARRRRSESLTPANSKAALSGQLREEGTPERPERRAAPDEIVVRNRSSEDVRALLYRSDDYCYMVPVVGKLLACGDVILQGEERRFKPYADSQEFTLKVYSVGPAAKELTYLTVRRGNAYTFCGSLLS